MKPVEKYVLRVVLLAVTSLSVTVASTSVVAEQATVVDRRWSDSINESNGTRFTCGENKVLVGRQHAGDENGGTKYQCAQVMQSDKIVTIGDPTWSSGMKESNSEYSCPKGQVMTGRYHEGDENGKTQYQCAQAIGSFGKPLDVVGKDSSEGEKESGHVFQCPKDAVMTRRAHSGDENGVTTYGCSTLW